MIESHLKTCRSGNLIIELTHDTINCDHFGVDLIATVAFYLDITIREHTELKVRINETSKKYSNSSDAGTSSVTFSNSAFIDKAKC